MRFAPLLLATLFVAPLHAQPTEPPAEPLAPFGLGVRVNDLLSDLSFSFNGVGPATGITLLVPLNTGAALRIEPEIGFSRLTQSDGDSDFSVSLSQFRTGVGFMGMIPNESYVLYVGGRFRYARTSEVVELPGREDDEESRTTVGVGPVVGGEHYFSSHFSLGAEAGLFYESYGFENDGEEADADVSSIATKGSVFIRFYF